MDEEENKGAGSEANQQPSQPTPGSSEEDEKDKASRVDAAKAFFRAMYAGEEPPQSFGQPEQQQQAETTTKTACRNCEGMEFALKEAEKKTAEAETLYKRMAADFENYRRRMERERDEAVSIGVKKAAEAMLPALDDLDRAMQFLNIETPPDKLLDSVKIVGNRILQCMEQLGVKPINAVGELFDPKYHEPVQQIETTEFADGTVMQELRRGYSLNDRVVRPALVNVASNSTGVVTSAGAEPATQESVEAEPVASSEPTEAPAPPPPPAPAAPSGGDDSAVVYDLEDTPDV